MSHPPPGEWLRGRDDGVVEVRSGKVEIGQGVLTALAQIVADELGIEASRIVWESSPGSARFQAGCSISMRGFGRKGRTTCSKRPRP